MSNENIFLTAFAAIIFAIIGRFIGVIVGSIYRKITDTTVPTVFVYLLSLALTIPIGFYLISDGSLIKNIGEGWAGLLVMIFPFSIGNGIIKSNKKNKE